MTSITRAWEVIKFPEKKCYVTLEWPLSEQIDLHYMWCLVYTGKYNFVVSFGKTNVQ